MNVPKGQKGTIGGFTVARSNPRQKCLRPASKLPHILAVYRLRFVGQNDAVFVVPVQLLFVRNVCRTYKDRPLPGHINEFLPAERVSVWAGDVPMFVDADRLPVV